MKFYLLAALLMLTNCSVSFNPDGSKDVTLDAVAVAKIVTQIIAEK